MMRYLLTSLFALILNVGCRDISPSNSYSDGSAHCVFIAATVPADATSRISLSDSSDGGYSVNWSEGDLLGGWFEMEGNDGSFVEFSMESFDLQCSTFSGLAPATASARFVYPYDATTILYSNGEAYNTTFDISLSSQQALAELANLCSTTYMVSDACDISDSSEELTSLTMRHLGSAMELNIKCEAAADYKLVDVIVAGAMIPTEVSVDLTRSIDEEYFEVVESGEINISVPLFAGEQSIFTVPFTIFPFVLGTGESIEVTATFVDDEGALYQASKELSNDGGAVSFERATKSTLNVLLDELTALDQTRVEITWEQVQAAAGLDGDGQLSSSKANNYIVIGDLSLTFSYLGIYSQFRYYGSSTITVECVGTMSSIDFGCDIGFSITEGGGVCADGRWEGSSSTVILKHNSTSLVSSSSPITIVYGPEQVSSGEIDTTPPIENDSTAYSGWAELPNQEPEMSGDYYYAYHMCDDTEEPMRNFSVCYSREMMCPVWVAAPLHSCYIGDAERQDKYIDDPDIPFEQGEDWDGYDRGHLLASSDRTITQNSNDQVFYRSNIGPQIDYGFNRSGGAWRYLEKFASEDQICSDTLYVVSGCYWADCETTSNGTVVPTHYYKAMLRTKSGSSGKAVWNCSEDELKCAGFLLEHVAYESGSAYTSAEMMMSITDLEDLTGHTFFTNVPNAPKSSYSAAEWEL